MNDDTGSVTKNLDQLINETAAQNGAKIVEPKGLRAGIVLGGFADTLLNYIVPLVSLILAGLIGGFVLYPSYNAKPDLEAQIASKEKLSSTLKQKVDTLIKLSDFKNVVSENSALVTRALASEEAVPGLLTQVDRITRESGLTITRLNYGLGSVATQTDDAGTAYTYDTVTVNLGITGSFDQLKTFLKNIENAARLINIDTMRYTLNETEEGSPLGINFVLVSPYLNVTSDAVTDDALDLDISNARFVSLINKVKNLKYYDPNDVDVNVPVVEAKPEEETTESTEATESAPTPPAL